MGNGLDWPDPHVEALKRHHAAGLAFSKISARLWTDFRADYSRNACIGKALRLGLPRRGKTPARADRRPHRKVLQKAYVPPRPKPVQFTCEPITELRLADVVPLNISIYELTDDTCRWPFGDNPPLVYCGHKPFPGFPYCASHVALSVRPNFEQRREAA